MPKSILGYVLLLTVLVAAPVAADETFPLKNVETHPAANGCVQYQATAEMKADIGLVFEVLSRPEKLAIMTWQRVFRVYVSTPYTYWQNDTGTDSSDSWYVDDPPSKILLTVGRIGMFQPTFWTEHDFDPNQHAISVKELRSEDLPGPDLSSYSAQYRLSAPSKPAITIIHFTSTSCWGASDQPYPKHATSQIESMKLREWLAAAYKECYPHERRSHKSAKAVPTAQPVATPNH